METKPKRAHITRVTEDEVLGLFNHQCSICGAPKPQLHHIDEDRTNNDPLNLLPLCPNHHLTDQHDPTRMIEQGRLKLFREYRDPTILKPQFQPLYRRLMQIYHREKGELTAKDLEVRCKQLTNFVWALEMGGYYGEHLDEVLFRVPHPHEIISDEHLTHEMKSEMAEHNQKYINTVYLCETYITDMVVEMLRYQKW